METATKACSVALSDHDRCIAEMHTAGDYRHSEQLTTYINTCLKTAGITPKDLAAISLSEGPGSFTGLRVGCSTAKGMCFGLDIPLIAIPSLYSLAWEFKGKGYDLILPMIDARRMEVYTCFYTDQLDVIKATHNQILTQEYINTLSESYPKILICGDGAFKANEFELKDGIQVHSTECRAANLIVEAFNKYKQQDFEDVVYFDPFYLKNANVTTPKKKLF